MGIKDNKDKMRVELDWGFIEEMAKRMDENKDKYPRDNWKKPINIVELEDAIIRHWFDYKRGDDKENHLAAIALNAMMIWYQKNNTLSNSQKITTKDYWNDIDVNECVKKIIENDKNLKNTPSRPYEIFKVPDYKSADWKVDLNSEFCLKSNNFTKKPPVGVLVDPPSGWKYGFPKTAPYPLPDNMTEWIIDNGYPRSEVENLKEHFLIRYSEVYE